MRAVGVGVASGLGLLAVAGTEQIIARRVSKTMSKHVGRVEIGSPWLATPWRSRCSGRPGCWASAASSAAWSTVATWWRRPSGGPTSEYVTAGPRSLIDFADIGKEGRRFVLMALTRPRS